MFASFWCSVEPKTVLILVINVVKGTLSKLLKRHRFLRLRQTRTRGTANTFHTKGHASRGGFSSREASRSCSMLQAFY